MQTKSVYLSLIFWLCFTSAVRAEAPDKERKNLNKTYIEELGENIKDEYRDNDNIYLESQNASFDYIDYDFRKQKIYPEIPSWFKDGFNKTNSKFFNELEIVNQTRMAIKKYANYRFDFEIVSSKTTIYDKMTVQDSEPQANLSYRFASSRKHRSRANIGLNIKSEISFGGELIVIQPYFKTEWHKIKNEVIYNLIDQKLEIQFYHEPSKLFASYRKHKDERIIYSEKNIGAFLGFKTKLASEHDLNSNGLSLLIVSYILF